MVWASSDVVRCFVALEVVPACHSQEFRRVNASKGMNERANVCVCCGPIYSGRLSTLSVIYVKAY